MFPPPDPDHRHGIFMVVGAAERFNFMSSVIVSGPQYHFFTPHYTDQDSDSAYTKPALCEVESVFQVRL